MARGKKKESVLTLEEKLTQALVPDWEWPYKVPKNWCWAKIGAISDFERGITFPASAKEDEPTEENIPCLRTANVQENLEIDDLIYVNQSFMKGNEAKLVRENDIIMSSANSRELVGKASFVTHVPFPMTFGGFVLNIRARGISSKYLFYFLRQEFLAGKFMGESTQTTNIANINTTTLGGYELPLPPLAEQQRIVDRIEYLFAKLDEAKEKAQSVLDSFETRKAAIFHKALAGELTAAWRKNNQEVGVDYVTQSRMSRDGEISARKAKKLKYAFPDDISLYSIPTGWQFAQIGDIAWSIKDGPHYSPEYTEDGVPFITGGNVRPEGVDFDSAKRISQELHQELSKRCHPDKGDMLYTKGGTTGIACINSYDFEFNVWVHVAVIKYVATVLPKYFQYVLNSPFCYEQSQKYTHGVGNQDLGLTRMINIVFPICSIAEQTEIVRILDNLFVKEQQAKEAAEAVLDKIDLLKKSILARAFRGELGTNDPTEESALELMKQVLQEDVPAVPQKRSKSIPKELQAKLSTELERKIVKLYFKQVTDSLPAEELLSVSSKKFEVMDSLHNLEQRGILKKLPNGNYRLLE